MAKLVSVIVTSYNHEAFLDQRMQSILKQTYKNIEVIVIDDCSVDNSKQVLEPYKKNKHVQIKCLKLNGGYANACNLGVELSSGEYIMFAECDDYNDPRHIELLVEALEADDSIGVAYCKSTIVNEKGEIIGDDFQYRNSDFKNLCYETTIIPKEKIQAFLLTSCVIPNMSAALFKKTHYIKIGGISPKYRACADWDFWCRMSELSNFFYITTPMNYFRTHATTVRSSFSIEQQTMEIFDLLFKFYKTKNLAFIQKVYFKVNLGSIWLIHLVSDPKQWAKSFFRILFKSLKYDKFCIIYLAIAFMTRLNNRTKLYIKNKKKPVNILKM
jgi:glycosyltransferase involved in cell wall biosynthesis